jgi:Uma2 family endonuclease
LIADSPPIGGDMSIAATQTLTFDAVPSLEALREFTAEPDHRVVIRNVNWAFYEQLVDLIPEGVNIHIDYDGKDLEIMARSPLHNGVKKTLGRFVELTAEELEIPCRWLGQTTWKRAEVARGLEANDCYFFDADKLTAVDEAMARRITDVAIDPNPDLAIEIDISPSKVDRPGIYSALGVAEVWRFDGDAEPIFIERRHDDGSYRAAEASGFLAVRPEVVCRWVVVEARRDGSLWARRLRAWVRAEVAPRRLA